MATGQAVSLDLPPALYERVRHLATQNGRSVEDVLLESLEVLFGAAEQEPSPAALAGYTDEQLWAVVYRRLAWTERERLRELKARCEREESTAAERAELQALLDEVDKMALLRSQALLLLKKRGVDVEHYLMPGA